jgi:multidrug efflux pump
MTFSIMGGLLVATVLTLFFLPTVYLTWFGDEDMTKPNSLSAEEERGDFRWTCAGDRL